MTPPPPEELLLLLEVLDPPLEELALSSEVPRLLAVPSPWLEDRARPPSAVLPLFHLAREPPMVEPSP